MNDRQQKQPLRKLRAKGRAIAGTQEFGSGERGEQVGLRVQVIGGEFDGQAIPWYGHFTPAAEERTIEQLQIAGWDGTDFANLPGLGSTEFELQFEEYEGFREGDGERFLYYKGQWINRLSVGMKNVLTPDQKADFAARMQAKYGKCAPVGQRSQQRANGTQRRQNAPSDDEWRPPTDEDLGL
jgi:hypothetical protein